MIEKLKDFWSIFKNSKHEFYKEKYEAIVFIKKATHLYNITLEVLEKNKEILNYLDRNIHNYPKYMFSYINDLVSLLKYGVDSKTITNKTFKFIEATIINDTKKISLANYYIQQSNLKFDCETTKSQFIAKLNNDPFFIENEIKKMANYANGVEINSNDVNVLCLNGINDNIFNLLIYILTKQKTKAFKLFNDLVKQKVQIINILQTISVQLFQLKLQKMLIEKYKFNFASKSLTELGINSFIVQKNLPILNLYTIDKLNQLLEKILLLDYNIKSNIVIPTIAFQLFVSEI